MEERGVFANGRGDECPSFGHLAGHGRERKRGALMVEVVGSVWKLEFWEKIGILENGILVDCGGRKRNKEKGKRKRNSYEEIFSWKRI